MPPSCILPPVEMLLRGQSEPSGELPSGTELVGIGDGGGNRRCRNHAEAWDRGEQTARFAFGVPSGELLVER